MQTTYGKKGGEGPTKGRKRCEYRGVFPDGTPFKKRSMHVSAPTAYAGVYWSDRDQRWYVAGVTEHTMVYLGHQIPASKSKRGELIPWTGQQPIPVDRYINGERMPLAQEG